MHPTVEYAATAMGLLIVSILVVVYTPMYWWMDIITVPFGLLFSLAVFDRLDRGE